MQHVRAAHPRRQVVRQEGRHACGRRHRAHRVREACPTHAINFGDLNDEASKVRNNANNNRSYHALEEVGIQPNIFYMTKVRNTESNEA